MTDLPWNQRNMKMANFAGACEKMYVYNHCQCQAFRIRRSEQVIYYPCYI